MALIRFRLDLAIPEAIFNRIPTARKKAFRDEVRAAKSVAVKIKEGQPNEENAMVAVWHKCYHDEGNRACDPEQEI
ncbi:hypothetical protein LCGC14_1391180 [marine sediment metagenome]|uniref:Uncharacterized protein n=1 Tax=marine sediment metagenome TaxID=412755 RepID=A0A0F9MFJ3_9ZZZZ